MLYFILIAIAAAFGWGRFGPARFRHVPALVWWTVRWDRRARPAVYGLVFVLISIAYFGAHKNPATAPAPSPVALVAPQPGNSDTGCSDARLARLSGKPCPQPSEVQPPADNAVRSASHSFHPSSAPDAGKPNQ